jgi:hypothetical protein
VSRYSRTEGKKSSRNSTKKVVKSSLKSWSRSILAINKKIMTIRDSILVECMEDYVGLWSIAW